MASWTTSAAVASRSTTTMRMRSVMTSLALSSWSSIELVRSCATDFSSVPSAADRRTREASSVADRAPDSSSRGSTPTRRSSAFADPLSTRITGLKSTVNIRCSGMTTRAAPSGTDRAKFLGISSPNSMEKPFTRSRASTVATASPTASDIGKLPNPEVSRLTRAGWAV